MVKFYVTNIDIAMNGLLTANPPTPPAPQAPAAAQEKPLPYRARRSAPGPTAAPGQGWVLEHQHEPGVSSRDLGSKAVRFKVSSL